MTPGKKTLFCLAFLLFAFVVSGCGHVFHSRALSLAGRGNFSQLAKKFEPPDRNFSKMPFSELIYLCSAYAGLKNYQNLFPCLDAAQTKVDAGECYADFWNHSSFPLRMKAVAYIELGQYEEAIKAAEASYKIIMDKNLKRYDQVQTLEVLGMAYGLAGMNRKAEAAIGNLKKILYSGSLGSLEDHINIALARIYITLKKYQETINVLSYKFEDSNTLVKAITGWDAFMGYKIQFEFMKNKSLFEVGRLAEAKEGYDILLRYPYILNQGEVYWNILFDRGRIVEKEGNVKEAINFYTKAVEVVEQQRATINTEAGKIGFVGDKQALYHNLIRALYQDGRYKKAFEYVERAKSRALVDLLASKKDFAIKGGNEKEIVKVLAMNDSAEAEAILQDASIDKNKTRSIQIKAREELKIKAPELASLVTHNPLPKFNPLFQMMKP
jgi:tetratricopeptide (TPR) repeat protein